MKLPFFSKHKYFKISDSELEDAFVNCNENQNPGPVYRDVKRKVQYQRVVIILQWIAITLILSFRVQWWWPPSHIQSSFWEQVYSPVNTVIRYHKVVFESGFAPRITKYQGPPSVQNNRAWDDLYSFTTSKITSKEASKLENSTARIPGEPGYHVISLDVFHQLHCLNMLRKKIWAEEVESELDEMLMDMDHLDHCVDSIRQSLMCSADVTSLPWGWSHEQKQLLPYANAVHVCRDFEAIKRWAKGHELLHFDRFPNEDAYLAEGWCEYGG